MNSLDELIQPLCSADKIVIVGHMSPDGDSIGSVLAMGMALEQLGKKVFMITSDPLPEIFSFLPCYKRYKGVKDFPARFDLALALDCSDLKRCGEDLSLLMETAPVLVNIDHHISNQLFAKYNFVNPKASATGEIVYHMIQKLGARIDQDIATCIYTAIVMDTGSFKFDNTSGRSHRIAADLIELGVPVSAVNTRLFEEKPYVNMKLLGEALKSLKMTPCHRVAWMSVSRETMEKLGAKEEQTDGIINYPKSIEGVEVGLLFREIEADKVKVGFRSKGQIDVNQVAGQFGGGGHPRAAGAIIMGNFHEIEEKVVDAVIKAFPG